MENIFLVWEDRMWENSTGKFVGETLLGVYNRKEIAEEQIELWKENYKPGSLRIEELELLTRPIKSPFNI